MSGPTDWKHGFLVIDVTLYGLGTINNMFHDLAKLASTCNCQVRTTVNGVPLSVSQGMTAQDVEKQFVKESQRRGYALSR
jgi:hypothetical protein